MKKIIMSLGFAAATIFAAQAQETPQDQQQFPQDETIEQYPEDQAQPETFPQDPSQEQYPEDQQDPTMEQDPTLQQDPGLEQDPTLQQDPAMEENPEMQQDPSLQEDPNLEQNPGIEQDPAMEQDPNLEQNPGQTEQFPQDETEQYPEDQTEQFPQDQQGQTPSEDQSQSSTDQQSQGQTLEGMTEISESELPQEVTDGIENSDYQGATIGQAYEISGNALDQVLNNRQGATGAVGPAPDRPEKLYQVQVTTEDNQSAILYLTEEGEVYEEKQF